MQITRRRLVPGEIDHELIWLTVSIGSLAVAAAWLGVGLPWPQCAFHNLTGFPCLTCGMTRSTIQFFHGHFLAALRWNPLVFAVLCGLSLFDGYAFAVLITRAPRLRIAHFNFTEKNIIRAAVIILVALNWIYLLVHWRAY
jgi:ABC-type sugar transport system permease subunit